MSKFLLFVIGIFVFGLGDLVAEERYVTTLADDGPGSLRSAVLMDGPANIIFRVSGRINLTQPIDVAGDDLTIHVVNDKPVTLVGFGIVITGSNFDIRNLRIWIGDKFHDPNDSPDQDGILVLGKKSKPVKNGRVSNCTVFAAVDEGISTYGDVSDILFFRNMILWGLNRSHHQDVVSDKNPDIDKVHHSMAILVSEGGERIRFAQNLLALNRHRNPRVMPGATVAFVNNFVYGWGTGVDDGLYFAAKKGIDKGLKIAFLNNYYQGVEKSFLLSKNMAGKTENFEKIYGSFFRTEYSKKFAIFDHGNAIVDYKGNNRPFNASPITFNSDMQEKLTENDFADLIQPEQVKKLLPATDVAKEVLKIAGAFPEDRDVVELKIVEQIKNAAGTYINSPAELNIGYPTSNN